MKSKVERGSILSKQALCRTFTAMSATIGTADEHRVLRIELLAAEKAHSKVR